MLKNGQHEHYFEGASFKLPVDSGEKLTTWIFIDPDFLPSQIMLQWKDEQDWEHRAYWGANNISLGTDGTNSRRRIGDIPSAGKWVQLELPANLVGLEGKLINGMKFTLFNGRAAWDRVGKKLASAPSLPVEPDFIWIDDATPPGSLLETVHDTWTDNTWVTNRYHGNLAHRHWEGDFNEPFRQHSFKNSIHTMVVNPGDTLFTYVYLHSDPQHRPDTLLLQWYDDVTGWKHRAYWGIDSRDKIAEKTSLEASDVSTEGWRYMGNIPASGQWVRLEVPASYVGLEGKVVKGMAFGIYQRNKKGRAVWDYSGKTSSAPTTQISSLKYTAPLWRYKCGSGGSERLYYSLLKDHRHFASDCTTQTNVGYAYSYPVPGTLPLYAWENYEGRWHLSLCNDCVGTGWTYRWIAAHIPASLSIPDTVVLKNYHCNNNHRYTTYPNPPDAVFPSGCTLLEDQFPFIHTR